ncbi:MAG TPA: hypothetical protein VGD50_06135, partial [Candidatus Baltobacteraceae bacterium]
MYALAQVALGLLVAHAAALLFFVTGTLFDERPAPGAQTSWRAMLRFVTLTVCGVAVWGLEGFCLGLAGLFTLAGFAVALTVNGAAFAVIRHENPFSHPFWSARIALIVGAFRGPAAIIYAVALLLCAPAALPDYSYDGVHVHLAYAEDWFRTGRIYAEQSMRFPYYAFNTELLYTWMMIARVGRYVPFFSWLTGTLTCLGAGALLAVIDERARLTGRRAQRIAADAVYVIMPLSLMLSAVFLRWWPTAMTDVTVCAFFLVAVASCALAALDRSASWLWTAAI